MDATVPSTRRALVAVAIILGAAVAAPAAGAQTGPLAEQLDRFRSTIEIAVDDYEGAYANFTSAQDEATRQRARDAMVQAGERVGQAFLAFESGHGDEASLSVFMQTQMDRGFYRAFEQDVVLLRATMMQAASGAPPSAADVQAQASPVTKALDRAEGCVPDGCASSLAGTAAQSFVVLLREGLEAILLLGAIIAYLRKTERLDEIKQVWAGVGAGIGASVLAWFALDRAFSAAAARGSVAHAVLEGVTMLLAALILFYVSFWLISKVEAERWQRFIDGKLKASLADDRTWMLAGIGFLAVFREGVETVLFLQAIAIGSGGAWGQIGLGLLVGVAALAGAYYLVHHASVRVPLRNFFAVTGGLLGLLAIRFVGLGLFELQEAGLLSTTPLPSVSQLFASSPILAVALRDVMGVSPTLEAVLGQGLLVGVFLAGAVWTVLVRPVWADPAAT